MAGRWLAFGPVDRTFCSEKLERLEIEPPEVLVLVAEPRPPLDQP